jgi:hypothetical protein
MTRPAMPAPDVAEVYDWLGANGINEWLPDGFHVTIVGDQLTYTGWKWAGERGWNWSNVVPGGAHEDRTVPLLHPPTDRVRELFTGLGLTLVERPSPAEPAGDASWLSGVDTSAVTMSREELDAAVAAGVARPVRVEQ